MSGIRIHHPSLRSCVLLVPHPGGSGRGSKEYHIHLDADGNSIVSLTVWSRLVEARNLGSPHAFMVLNEVFVPPTLVLARDGNGLSSRVYRQRSDGIATTDLVAVAQQFAPKGIVPRITHG